MTNSEFKIVSARIGPYTVSGEMDVIYDYETQTDTVDTHCGTKTEQTDVELFDVMIDTDGAMWLEIEHDDWPETRVLTSDDDEALITRWVDMLNEQSDQWWTTEITSVNDIWQYID